jgi:hypothetical protein
LRVTERERGGRLKDGINFDVNVGAFTYILAIFRTAIYIIFNQAMLGCSSNSVETNVGRVMVVVESEASSGSAEI